MAALEPSDLVEYLTSPATIEEVETEESAALAGIIGDQNEATPAWAELQHKEDEATWAQKLLEQGNGNSCSHWLLCQPNNTYTCVPSFISILLPSFRSEEVNLKRSA